MRSQVQACPGATRFGYENIFNVNGPGLPSLHLSFQVWARTSPFIALDRITGLTGFIA